MSNPIGHDIGRYHIVEQLGQGGMATVYKAYDTRLERDVAIKFIRVDQIAAAQQVQMLKRFEREGKSLARLEHPNIIPIFDFGEHEGTPYLVMRFIPGGTLKKLTGTPMPYGQACRLLAPVARALEYAHSLNLIHRDVKPANILITAAGEPMLSDFGVAKILESDEGNTLTGTGVGIGTPEYMAPEQWLNRVVPQTDIYALGVVFYELVTGHKPYTADTPAAVLLKQASDPLPRPNQFVPGLPAQVEQVIYKALAKKPEDRYTGMGEFAAALEKLSMQTGPGLPPAPLFSAQPTALVAVQTQPALPVPASQFETLSRAGPLSSTIPQPPAPPEFARQNNRKGWIGLVGGLGTALVGGVLLVLLAGGIWLAAKMASPGPALAPARISTEKPVTLPAAVPTLPLTPTEVRVTPTESFGIGSSRISDQDGMKLLYVPAGEFQMGSTEAQIQAGITDCVNSGGKQSDCQDFIGVKENAHTVYLDAFWIDQTDVTTAKYARCVSAGVCQPPSDTSSHKQYKDYYGYSRFADYPVIFVDWSQADTYCKWVGRRLPTEAQWEKAARGTDGRTYPWGEGLDKTRANYDNFLEGDTSKVGSYPSGASPYGALDMAGNVWQWVADWYGSYSSSSQKNPQGPSSGKYRILRGGAYDSSGFNIPRSAFRFDTGFKGNNSIGFRCALAEHPGG